MSRTRDVQCGARRTVALSSLLVALVAPAGQARAAVLPQGFQETTLISGLDKPSTYATSPDGRIFVAEKSGIIKVFHGFGDKSPVMFADLRTNVHNYWDRGLLGLALHPSFPSVPYVYVLYTYDAPPGGVAPTWGSPGGTTDACPSPPGPTDQGCVVQGRLSRLTASGDVATGGEQVLLQDWCQQFPSHSVGTVTFGPDGALYVGAGDGASFNWTDYGQAGIPLNPCGDPPTGVGGVQTPPSAEGGALRAQDLLTNGDPVGFDGAILRVDPDTGQALPDNPLYGGSVPDDDRIIAYGLRNPFRFAIRPGTSEVWLGDVGWGAVEEINRIKSPTDGVVENFGWPCYEGTAQQGGYKGVNLALCQSLYAKPQATTPPTYAWAHGQPAVPNDPCGTGAKGSSAAGIAFYQGGTYPAAYKDAMFFADYSRGCIWAMKAGGNGEPDPTQVTTFASEAAGPVDLRIGPGGDLTYVDHLGGTIRRIEYFQGNVPPVAAITATPTSGPAPLTVHFDGSASFDDNPSDALSMSWDLDGDGTFGDSTSVAPEWTYVDPGTVLVSLRVTDFSGAMDTATVTISANDTPPVVKITQPGPTSSYTVGSEIVFEGSATDQQDGPLPPEALTWTIIQHHCPSDCHEHVVQQLPGVSGGSFFAPDHEYPSHLELVLDAVDSSGLAGQTSMTIDPTTVVLTFASDPPGLALSVGGAEQTAPFDREVIVGSKSSVGAVTPQTLGGTTYKLAGWSDGGALSHDITAPASPATYTALFVPACGDGVLDPGEACDPAIADAGCCTATCALPPAGTSCDDGDSCTAGDTCEGSTCGAGPHVLCGDGNRCTDDGCDPLTGCVYTFNAAPCSDGTKCTKGDTCDQGSCQSGAPVDCADGNPCTSDACDPLRGCKSPPITGACDDGDACTGHDRCLHGTCTGRALGCDDGNPCTADSCAPGIGCVHTPIEGCAWSDGCTVSDKPGCAGCTCKACVCAADPYCCHLAWDATCVAACTAGCGQSCP